MAAVGYVMGARRNPDAEAAAGAGARPRAEYQVLAERGGVRLLDYAALDGPLAPLARMLVRRGMPHIALPVHVLRGRTPFDGFLATGEDIGLPLALLAAVYRDRRPLHIITHGSYLRSGKFRAIMRVLRGRPNVHFLCLSRSLSDTFVEEFGADPARAHATGYGVDTRFFTPRPLPQRPRPLLVSAGMANRDYRTLVRAVAGLDVDLRIAADSAWYRSSLDIASEDLPPNVEVRSAGDYEGLRDLYAQATAVVVPLYPARHACGYAVIAEAMAMGKPVVVTQTENVSDFVVAGENGCYVQPGDAEGLRATLQRLLDRPGTARDMGCAARERMESDYSLDAYCARIERAIGLSPAQDEPAGVSGPAEAREERNEEDRVCYPAHKDR